MRLRRRTFGLAALVLTGLVAAGCAIPVQQGPSTISPSHVPFGLLSPQLPSTTTTQPFDGPNPSISASNARGKCVRYSE